MVSKFVCDNFRVDRTINLAAFIRILKLRPLALAKCCIIYDVITVGFVCVVSRENDAELERKSSTLA